MVVSPNIHLQMVVWGSRYTTQLTRYDHETTIFATMPSAFGDGTHFSRIGIKRFTHQGSILNRHLTGGKVGEVFGCTYYWLAVSTHLRNISQNGNLPQIGMNIKNIWNHHLDYSYSKYPRFFRSWPFLGAFYVTFSLGGCWWPPLGLSKGHLEEAGL